ncbi:hypothetical protein TA3x_004215 [Tundrisphaera sp. TA3]|uniref:hypothetical protein n=1 Tax=Tundrisphaera sp. TA3 TaxID=3435775 RepID=UPI003EBF74EF
MLKRSLIPLALTAAPLLCMGCDAAARQQEARQARRQQIVDDLKARGEAMHNESGGSTPHPGAAEAPVDAPVSPPKGGDPPG